MHAFSVPHFRNDDAARAYLESLLWPEARQSQKRNHARSAYVPEERAAKEPPQKLGKSTTLGQNGPALRETHFSRL
jgi:hypothetical protein